MENIYQLILASAFVLMLTIQTGDAISCHVCNSKIHDGCTSLTGDNYVEDCNTITYGENGTVSHQFNMCRKIKQTVEGETRVIRSCAYSGKLKCVDRTGTKEVKVTYCQCEGDKCNTAAALYRPSVAFLFLTSLIVTIMKAL